tara:strand:- start:2091 stop:3530 length:1440 start_codon:yes stop_codon:yes gene_type:complete
MAIVINTQPDTNIICSTLIPIVFDVTETTASTTNIIASCYYIDQATGLITTQIGAEYRMAPNLSNVDNFIFDASEIFNIQTKYTLNDAPNNWKLGQNSTLALPFAIQDWREIAGWKVRVKFQREYLDTTTGLIVLDPAYTNSNLFYIHEGSPTQKYLNQLVESNGQSGVNFTSVFDNYSIANNPSKQNQQNLFLTNHPLDGDTLRIDIHETEQYMLGFFPDWSAYYTCEFRISVITYDVNKTPLSLHYVPDLIPVSDNLTTVSIGFRDLQNSLTPSAGEGTNFSLVGYYSVYIQSSTSNDPISCNYLNFVPTITFKVDRSCILNSGYLRFCFKNMLGAFDQVTSKGVFKKSAKNKFTEYEQSLGYFPLKEKFHSMQFSKGNWSNENTISYSVTTQPMKPDFAKFFAEMFSSTEVYLREKNDSNLLIQDSTADANALAVPYKFIPIVITGGSSPILNTDDNLVRLKFKFEMSVNQRNPRN